MPASSVVSKTSDYFIITAPRRRALHLLILSGDQGALVALIAPTASLLPPSFCGGVSPLLSPKRSGSPPIALFLRPSGLLFSVTVELIRLCTRFCRAHFLPRRSLITDSVRVPHSSDVLRFREVAVNLRREPYLQSIHS